MKIDELLKMGVPDFVVENYKRNKITKLNSGQVKAIKKGLLDGKNLLICTPTGSGKTAMATLAITKTLKENGGKAIYLVPLKALANEKFKDYKELFNQTKYKVAISTGEIDSRGDWMGDYDLSILTVEKMDSLIRHHAPWLSLVKTVIIDEIHLLNDPGRGPTLEILITIIRKLLKNVQIIALSATIGNSNELAAWLQANLVLDNWRPVKLHKGVYYKGEVEFG